MVFRIQDLGSMPTPTPTLPFVPPAWPAAGTPAAPAQVGRVPWPPSHARYFFIPAPCPASVCSGFSTVNSPLWETQPFQGRVLLCVLPVHRVGRPWLTGTSPLSQGLCFLYFLICIWENSLVMNSFWQIHRVGSPSFSTKQNGCQTGGQHPFQTSACLK